MDKNITMYLDDLRDIIDGAKKPMFGGGKIVDDGMVLTIIDRIEDSLPAALKEAKYVIRDCEKLRQDAREDARRILEDAGARADDMVAKHSITKQAEEEGRAIISHAKGYANALDFETKHHIDKVFQESEDQLAEFLQIIRASRENLKASILKNAE